MAFGAERLAAALAELTPGWRSAGFCVALSGGLDSTVLLDAMAELKAQNAGLSLRALHVDHGLQPESGAWAASCAALCGRLGVPFAALRLELVPAAGESVEAAARCARYEALRRELAAGEWLLTAHHQDDQLETVLIQLLRGAGVAGLAAMPAAARFGAGMLGRPLLAVERRALEDHARDRGLAAIRDPMNDAARFDRGWLRREVLPAIRSRWPSAAATVARSARHLAQAQRLLTGLAAADAEGRIEEGRLSLEGLRELAPDRQVNLLRWWIQSAGLQAPPAARLASAMTALLGAARSGRPLLAWPEGEVRRYRERLYAMPPLAPAPCPSLRRAITGSEPLRLGEGLGEFSLAASVAGGLPASCRGAEIRFRSGGEMLRPHPERPRKRLKDLCQEAGIVPWMRERLPLVYVEGRLAAVADLWIDADFRAAPDEPALAPRWSGRPELT